MGSYAECWLGSFYVGSSKNDVDPGLMQLFRASDKIIIDAFKNEIPAQLYRWREDDDYDPGELTIVYYRAPAKVVKDRLELMGYTLEVAKDAFNICIQSQARRYQGYSSKYGDVFKQTAELLSVTDANTWITALGEIHNRGLKQYDNSSHIEPDGTLIDYMLRNDWYGYTGPDTKIGLRLALEVCSRTDEFLYDLTELVISGYFSVEEDIIEYTSNLLAADYSLNSKIIVLTEGHSDSWIIAETLQLLYPHLADYYSFLDFEGAKVAGGAGNLANILKAFAAAGVVNKVVALFDNDTAGNDAIHAIRQIQFPRNVRILRLPYLSKLANYPTMGPSGLVVMDINEVAASIELYLGLDVLVEETGDLTPVQWTGYNVRLGKYQGEILFKDEIHKRFKKRLNACKVDSGLIDATDWDGLKAVLSTLFMAYRDEDENEILSSLEEYYA